MTFHLHLFVEVLIKKGYIIHANRPDNYEWLAEALPKAPEFEDLQRLTQTLEHAHKEQAKADERRVNKLKSEKESSCLCFRELKQDEIEEFLNVQCFPRYRVAYDDAINHSRGVSMNPMMIVR